MFVTSLLDAILLACGPTACSQQDYREFRRAVFATLKFDQNAKGREKIKRFRDEVAMYADEWLDRNRRLEAPILRSLHIPRETPLFRPWWLRVLLFFGFVVVPPGHKLRFFHELFRRTHCIQGRRLVFARYISQNRCSSYLHEELDGALRRLEGLGHPQEVIDIEALPTGWPQAGTLMGLLKPSDLLSVLTPYSRQIRKEVVNILAAERILTRPEQLALVPQQCEDIRSYHDWFDEDGFAKTLRILRKAGVPVEQLLTVSENRYFYPEDLQRNVDYLNSIGINDLSLLYQNLQSTLWATEVRTLSSVVEVLGASTVDLLIKCKEILKLNGRPSADLVKVLQQLGASFDDLLLCSKLYCDASNGKHASPQRVQTLIRTHGFTFEQLSQANRLLSLGRQEDFGDFLQVMSRHGLNDATSLIAFNDIFGRIYNERLDNLICLSKVALPILDANALSVWVSDAHDIRPVSMSYLLKDANFRTKDLGELRRLTDLSRISKSLLMYLVERQHLDTLQLLHGWNKTHGRSARAYSGGDTYSAVERVLFEDAIKRGDFGPLAANVSSIENALGDYAREVLKESSSDASQEGEEYWHRRDSIRCGASAALSERLPDILSKTGGLVVESMVLAALSPDGDLAEVVRAFGPTIDALLNGQGPTSKVISSIELDAVAHVYHLTSEQVRERWQRACGYSDQLDNLILRTGYPMFWRQKSVKLPPRATYLREYRAFDSTIAALRAATDFATTLISCSTAEWSSHFARLKAKALENRAATTAELQLHLGLLLAIAGTHEGISSWIRAPMFLGEDAVEAPETTYQALETADAIITVTLVDHLSDAIPAFVASLVPPDREELAKRLNRNAPQNDANDISASLCKSLIDTLRRCTTLFGDEIRVAKDLFERAPASCDTTPIPVMGVLSKHPAAFLARASANICSKDDFDMWEEQRHAHFLVFDPNLQRLVGMAMFYIQPIEGFKSEPCLVVRAINPLERYQALFEEGSVVDELLRVAVEIAQDNSLACVAVVPIGSHLSNRPGIETAFHQSLWAKKAKRIGDSSTTMFNRSISYGRPLFYCRAQHVQADAVGELSVIWTASEQPKGNQEHVVAQPTICTA